MNFWPLREGARVRVCAGWLSPHPDRSRCGKESNPIGRKGGTILCAAAAHVGGNKMFLQDLRFACRTLCKNPAFALTASLTIALGVGASTTIFSVTDAVLLAALAIQRPGSSCHSSHGHACSQHPRFSDLQREFRRHARRDEKRVSGPCWRTNQPHHLTGRGRNARTSALRSSHN